MSALYRMITRPAALTDLEFEEDLPGKILDETATEPGALALMAYALELLYEARDPSGKLTRKGYDSFGGVRDAIGRHAQAVFDALESSEKDALGEVFSQLVTVDAERGVPTRKRADLSQFNNSVAALRFIDRFTDRRLLVKRREQVNRTIVEVAHEALLTRWPLLEAWIRSRFDDFCLLRLVCQEAREWEKNGRPDSYLWPHERLCSRLSPKLQDYEREFIRSESERLEIRLNDPQLEHQARERIGVRLAEIVDPRKGVGLDQNGLPEIEWCRVPGGRIELGGGAGSFYVGPFYIGKYPVTWKQYRCFVESETGYVDKRWWSELQDESEPGEQYRKVENHPAECVSWFDAMAFCRWLSSCLAYEVRLPTEWEWQQAVSPGRSNPGFPWGKAYDSNFSNTLESGLGRTTAVGLYPAGAAATGALDMSGNVWEWCLNEYDNPERIAPGGGGRRVVRGGSWNYDQDVARAAYRHYGYPPDHRNLNLGFRLCCSAPIMHE